MRLVITQNMSLDGRIEFLGDWFDPVEQDEGLLELQSAQAKEERVLLLGRQTFEDFRSFWPKQTGDETYIADHLNKVSKRVFSTTMNEPMWENTEIVRADPADYVRTMKRQGGDDEAIGLTGSITLTHRLMLAGVVDELRVLIHPAIQGNGRGLFPDRPTSAMFALNNCMSFPSGVLYASYRPA